LRKVLDGRAPRLTRSFVVRRSELAACSDEQLLSLFTRGELEAMEVLLERYKRPVFSFVLRLIGDRARAEDLLQETFLRLVEHAHTFEGNAKLKTWIFRIARNQCIDESRRRVHRRHPSLDAPIADEANSATLHDRLASKEAGAERRTVGSELKQRMAEAIKALPEEQREVFLLRQVQNLAFKEIADITGVSENTVKSRMRYALERLQGALAEYQDYAEELR
jgi:RNA polymerase sigma-70 factor (ECF subfamily)